MSGEMLPQPPPLDGPPVLEPKRIKVFGVIHIVFGALGLIGAVFSLVVLLAIHPLLDWGVRMATEEFSSNDPSAVAAQEAVLTTLEAMGTMFSDLTIPNWVQAVTSAIVSVLILIAGIRLVKHKKTSLASNNRYVWCSIGAKVINLVLFFTIGMAATRKYYETVDGLGGMAGAPGPGGLDMTQLQQMFAGGSTVVGVALALVYPILALVMLNKPEVKSYLDQQGR